MEANPLYHHRCKICNLPNNGCDKINKLLMENPKWNDEPNYREVFRIAREEFPDLNYMNVVNHGNNHFNVKMALKKKRIHRVKTEMKEAVAQKLTMNQFAEKVIEVGADTIQDPEQLRRIPPKDKVRNAIDVFKEKNQSRLKGLEIDVARDCLLSMIAGDKRRLQETNNVIEAEYATEPKRIATGNSAG